MLTTNIPAMMRLKGVDNPYGWMRKHGIPRGSALKLLSGKAKRIDLRHLDIICFYLRATMNDMHGWLPNNKAQDVPGHPLQDMRLKSEQYNITEDLRELPPAKIREVAEIIRQKKNEK